mgnify:CR=1 FL=1
MIKHYRTLLLVFALFCNTVVIQAQNVSLKLNNVTVKEAIEAVKKQTGKSFFFNVNDVDLNHRVNIDLKDAPLGKALSQILQGQDIDYEVKDNHIVLSKRNSTKNNQTFTPSVRAVTMLNIKGFAEKRLFFVNTECIIRTDSGVTSYNKMRIYLV